MLGVITRREVLAHPFVIFESFGVRVLVRALTSGADETFLDVVSRCAEEESHRAMADVDLSRTVESFLRFELRARALYLALAEQHSGLPDAATFFSTLAGHEEGHAIVLAHVRSAVRRGRCWKESARAFRKEMDRVDGLLAHCETEARGQVGLARALELVEELEGSELNLVFDTLRKSSDLHSRVLFEGFFVLTERHLAFCADQIRALRGAHGIAGPASAPTAR